MISWKCCQKHWQQNKNRQVGLHQTKNLLHSKGNNQQSEKATYRMGENNRKPYI